jgi:hypothetical protein
MARCTLVEREHGLDLLRQVVLVRRCEERCVELYRCSTTDPRPSPSASTATRRCRSNATSTRSPSPGYWRILDIPERDYDKIAVLGGLLDYLAAERAA